MIRARYVNKDGSSGRIEASDWEKLVEQLEIEDLEALYAVKTEDEDEA